MPLMNVETIHHPEVRGDPRDSLRAWLSESRVRRGADEESVHVLDGFCSRELCVHPYGDIVLGLAARENQFGLHQLWLYVLWPHEVLDSNSVEQMDELRRLDQAFDKDVRTALKPDPYANMVFFSEPDGVRPDELFQEASASRNASYLGSISSQEVRRGHIGQRT